MNKEILWKVLLCDVILFLHKFEFICLSVIINVQLKMPSIQLIFLFWVFDIYVLISICLLLFQNNQPKVQPAPVNYFDKFPVERKARDVVFHFM